MDEHVFIPSSQLRLEEIPRKRATWSEIGRFALTFDIRDETTNIDTSSWYNVIPDKSSCLIQLRYYLYCEQRRWNHYHKEPDYKLLQEFKQIVEWIRKHVEIAGT